jgi:peptide/nickel transport system substrate-binding protein
MGSFGVRGAVLRRAIALALGAVLANSAALADETPRRGGTLTYPMPLGDPDTFDCHASQSIVALTRLAPHYSTLVRLDPATYPAVSPDAAQSWTVSPDGLTYSFHLAPDIPFHDGSTLTSADVKATYERLRNPAPDSVSMRQQQFRDIAEIATPDSATVVFHLAKVNPAMLTVFASPWNCLYSAKKLAEDPRYPASEVMGSGPFRFAEYVPGSIWRGERFENYFQKGLPYLDGFKIVNLTSPTIGNALVAGQINFDIFGLSPQDQQRVATSRGETVKKYGPMSVLILYQLRLNTERPPFNDVRVRQAMRLIPNRPQMVEQVLSGQGRVANDMYAPLDPAYDSSLPQRTQDLEKAKALLKQAGHSGLTVQLVTAPVFQGVVQAAEVFAQQASGAGVNVQLRKLDTGTFYGPQYLKWTFAQDFWATREYLPQVAQGSLPTSPFNECHWADPTFLKLIQQARSTLDQTKRDAILRQAEAIEYNTGGYIIPYFSNQIDAYSAKLGGLVEAKSGFPLGNYWFKNVGFTS